MNSPFGSSNQGGFRQQPQQQNFGQQGGFGVQTAGTFGGFQPQQQSFGFGGGQGFGGFQPQQNFGGFGGGQGFGGFNPFQGGFGGFQPQQQFNPFQGGYGGGFNPMFGGIGGLGFNPMMGPQFGMPMQGFNPYQIQMMDKQRQFEQQQFNPYQQQFQPQQQVSAPWMPTITETPGFGDWQQKQKQWVDQTPEGISYTKANEALEAFKKANPNPFSYSEFFGGDPALRAQHAQLYGEYQKAASPYYNKLNEYEKTNPFSPTAQQPQSPFTGPQRSAQDILSMAVGNMPKDMQYDLNKDGKITSADALAYRRKYEAQLQQPAPESPGLGRLPYDPEYERPAGYGTTLPATLQTTRKENTYVDPSGKLVSSQTGKKYRTASDMVKGDRIDAGETFTTSPMMSAMTSGIGGLGFNPMMGPQFGMPMQGMGGYGGFNPSQPQQQAQLMQALQAAQMRAVMGI